MKKEIFNKPLTESLYIHADCMDKALGLPSLPEGSINLLIVDPPYFEVKGEFDWAWDSFEDYLRDVETWAKECTRVLAKNGSLFWWGHAKKIAYTQIILDKYLQLENSCVWRKIDCRTMQNHPPLDRVFPPITERCLFYSFGEKSHQNPTGLQAIHDDPDLFLGLKGYLDEALDAMGHNISDANKILGTIGMASHYFGYTKNRTKVQWHCPTKENWEKLASAGYFRREYEDFRQEYEGLRQEYEELRRPFNNTGRRLFDTWDFSQESHRTKEWGHPTQKPPKLIRELIEITTRPGDLVCAPFGGSGVDGEQAVLSGRQFIGYEIDEKYHRLSTERLRAALKYTPSASEPVPGEQISIFQGGHHGQK